MTSTKQTKSPKPSKPPGQRLNTPMYIDKALIAHLQKNFLDKVPVQVKSLEQIHKIQGEQRVINHIISKYRQQTEEQ